MKLRPAILMTLSLCAVSETYAQTNGGTTCPTATQLVSHYTYTADTTSAPNWMTSFGPLVSPSNDVVYTFTAPIHAGGIIATPTASNYAFALYLITSCLAGAEPPPIGATATIGVGIDLAGSGVVDGQTYFLAVTGTAAGGATANGTVTFDSGNTPVTLQSFEVE